MKKVILLILDGFGLRDAENANAIKMANLPNIKKIMDTYPMSKLETSGEIVGLPKGVITNCEAAHMTIGAGRCIKQPYTIINESIQNKSFFENDVLLDLTDHVKNNASTLHLIGLISDSGVHSSIEHFYAAVGLAKIQNVKKVVFHFITDGKDIEQTKAYQLINEFMQKIEKLELGTIGTICGRYYAMDSNGNYDRIKKAYDAMVFNVGNNFADYKRCLELHYKNNITDEFINPSIITKGSNINDNDAILFVDFRPEKMDELINTFVDSSFNMFNTKKFNNIKIASLYSVDKKIQGAYKNEELINTFGKYLAELDYKQTRIAEADKFIDVTYFFDGAENFSNKNLYKILVPSPNVARYDMKPEMSIVEVTNATISAMENDFDFILVNFANPDAVGHTGNLPAVIKSLEACDVCINKILEVAQENFYDLVITSDHGNAEIMKDENGNAMTGFTDNKVPFIICNEEYKLQPTGSLIDIVPTITDIYEISKPKEMTGNSLIIK